LIRLCLPPKVHALYLKIVCPTLFIYNSWSSSKQKGYKSAYSEGNKRNVSNPLSGELGYKYEFLGDNVPSAVVAIKMCKEYERGSWSQPQQNITISVVQQKATLEEQSYKNREPGCFSPIITKAQTYADMACRHGCQYKPTDSQGPFRKIVICPSQ